MAAVTTIIVPKTSVTRVRTITASAAATTDAVAIPTWARYVRVLFNATTVTTNVVWNVQQLSYGATVGTYDTTTAFNLAEHTAFTTVTAASLLTVDIGPGITGIADDVTNSATANSRVALNTPLPQVLYLLATPSGNLTATIDIEVRS